MRRWQCKHFTVFQKAIFTFQDCEILHFESLTRCYFDHQQSFNAVLLRKPTSPIYLMQHPLNNYSPLV